MSAGAKTRGSRAFVAVGVVWFVCFNATVMAGTSRTAATVLGLHGFVFAVIFGKAYALVPSYFDRELVTPSAPLVHLPLALVGVAGLFLGRLPTGDPLGALVAAAGLTPNQVLAIGAVAWLAGVFVFVGTLAWSVRDNLTGAETGTAGPNRHRRRVDRAANAVVPIVALYLLWGSILPVAEAFAVGSGRSTVPPFGSLMLLPAGPAGTHVLAAGAATLLLFGIGFRLLPRFLVETPRTPLVAIALLTGALAPAMMTADFRGDAIFTFGASLLATAIASYALVVLDLIARSDRRRVGFTAIAAGAVFGLLVVSLGWGIGVAGLDLALIAAHYRLALGGFLGLTIVGVSFQFYPPAIGEAPGVGDRNAVRVIYTLATGLAIEALGAWLAATDGRLAGIDLGLDPELVTMAGTTLALIASLGYAWILLTIFAQRR